MDGAAVLFGTVKSTNDPDKLGRVQVALAGYGPELVLPWVRLVQPLASKQHGFFFLPEPGDEVAVLRGQGDHPDAMIVLGCLYNGKNKPKKPDDGKSNTKQILTRAGNQITISDESGKESITLQVKGDKTKVILDAAAGKVTIESDKEIALVTKNTLSITCDQKVTVSAAEATVDAKQKAVVKAAQIEIAGNAQVAVTSKGALKVEATGPLELKGAMVNIG